MGFLGFSLAILFMIGILFVVWAVTLWVGFSGTVWSMIGLFFSRVMRKAGRTSSKTVKRVSIIALVASLAIFALPLSIAGVLVWSLATPPEDFVETEIRIEGELEEDFDSFTADGMVYHALELSPDYEGCQAIATPIFSYMPEGMLSRSEWMTFYRIENGEDFDLIWDGEYQFFCTDEDRDAILAHYEQTDVRWYLRKYPEFDLYSDEDPPRVEPSPEALQVINTLLSLPATAYSDGAVEYSRSYFIDLEQVSRDGAVFFDYYALYVLDGAVYYAPDAILTDNYTLEGDHYRLSDEMAKAILAMFDAD